jgi:sec-independent protein translocase protein TatB
MFDVGPLELVVIFVVALVVLGPTRLPGLVRTMGRWVGKARSMARDFQQQLESEANLEELNRMTERRTREAQTPAPPPEFTGAPVEPPPATDASSLANSGYPYGTPAPGSAPQPGDDTYSHAHAAGEAPQAPTPEDAGTHEPHKPAV